VRLFGRTVPATRNGDWDSRLSVSTGVTPTSATSDTAAGAARCRTRRVALADSGNDALHDPSAAVTNVVTVDAVPAFSCWSSSGAPASGAPVSSAKLPDSCTVVPALTTPLAVTSVSAAGDTARPVTTGRIEGRRAEKGVPGQSVRSPSRCPAIRGSDTCAPGLNGV